MMQLLESKKSDTKKGRSVGGTISSVILHVLVIFLAVFATARAGTRKPEKVKAENVKFMEIKKEPPPPKKDEPPPPKKPEPPKPDYSIHLTPAEEARVLQLLSQIDGAKVVIESAQEQITVILEDAKARASKAA